MENLGFNVGLNTAVERAITDGFDWLATMTVRAKPNQHWLAQALSAVTENTGMVTTLHLDHMDKVDCLGHNLGPAGQLFNFAESVPVSRLSDFQNVLASDFPIWGPCSGGALYRVEALKAARDVIGQKDLIRPRGFKSYNCDALAFSIRGAGYFNALARAAICKRHRSGSTSKNPDTPGLLMNQEINRIANLFEYWPTDRARAAVELYLHPLRARIGLKDIDLRIARTHGEGIARTNFSKVAEMVSEDLGQHLAAFQRVKDVREMFRDTKAA